MPTRFRAVTVVWTRLLPLVLVLLGVEMRLRQWSGNRSLWLDEAALADNFLDRTVRQLVTEPLSGNQGAPVGWLLATRLDLFLFGTSNRVLRLVPLLAGFVSLLAFWVLARRLLRPALVPVALVLFVGSPALLYYANEAKQYSSDVAVTLLLLLAAVAAPTRRAALWALGLGGAVAVWCSHPAVFVLAGASVALVLQALVERRPREATVRALVLSAWVVSFAASYLLVLRSLQDSATLARFWAPTFPSGAGDLDWPARRAVALVGDPLHWEVPGLALALLGVGLLGLARRNGLAAGALAGVVLAGWAGAAASAYPLAGRLALWVVPVLLLMGTGALLPWRGRLGAAFAALLALALLGVARPALVAAAPLAWRVTHVEELAPVMSEVLRERRTGEALAVHVGAVQAYRFYGVHRHAADAHLLVKVVPRGPSCADAERLAVSGFSRGPVWVFFSHDYASGPNRHSAAATADALRGIAHVVRRVVRDGASASLFVPDGAPLPAPPGPTCLTVGLLAVPL